MLQIVESPSESNIEKLRKENIEAHSRMFKEIFPDGILLDKSNLIQVSTRRKPRSTSHFAKPIIQRQKRF